MGIVCSQDGNGCKRTMANRNKDEYAEAGTDVPTCWLIGGGFFLPPGNPCGGEGDASAREIKRRRWEAVYGSGDGASDCGGEAATRHATLTQP